MCSGSGSCSIVCCVIVHVSYKVQEVLLWSIIKRWDPVQRLTAVVDDVVGLETSVFICNIVLHSRCCVSCFHLFYQCRVPLTQGYANPYQTPSPNLSNILPVAWNSADPFPVWMAYKASKRGFNYVSANGNWGDSIVFWVMNPSSCPLSGDTYIA